LWRGGHATANGSRFTKDRRVAMRLAALVLMLTALVASAYRWTGHDPLPEFPRVMLWAWERPEKLDFINPSETGVAFLARTIYLRRGMVTVLPRLQPLVVSPATALMAVVRIESQPDSERTGEPASPIAGEL